MFSSVLVASILLTGRGFTMINSPFANPDESYLIMSSPIRTVDSLTDGLTAKSLYSENPFVKKLGSTSINIKEQKLDGFYNLFENNTAILMLLGDLDQIKSEMVTFSTKFPQYYALLLEQNGMYDAETDFTSVSKDRMQCAFLEHFRSKSDVLKDSQRLPVEYIGFIFQRIFNTLNSHKDIYESILTGPLAERIFQIEEFRIFFDTLTDEYKDVPTENIILFLNDVIENNLSLMISYTQNVKECATVCRPFSLYAEFDQNVMLNDYLNDITRTLDNIKKEMIKEKLMKYSRGDFLIHAPMNNCLYDITPKEKKSKPNIGIHDKILEKDIDEIAKKAMMIYIDSEISHPALYDLSTPGHKFSLSRSYLNSFMMLNLITPYGKYKLSIQQAAYKRKFAGKILYNYLDSPYITTPIRTFYSHHYNEKRLYEDFYINVHENWDDCLYSERYNNLLSSVDTTRSLFRDVLSAFKYLHEEGIVAKCFFPGAILVNETERNGKIDYTFKLIIENGCFVDVNGRYKPSDDEFERMKKSGGESLLEIIKNNPFYNDLVNRDTELERFVHFFEEQLKNETFNIDELLNHSFISISPVETSQEVLKYTHIKKARTVPEHNKLVYKDLKNEMPEHSVCDKMLSFVSEKLVNADEQISVNGSGSYWTTMRALFGFSIGLLIFNIIDAILKRKRNNRGKKTI